MSTMKEAFVHPDGHVEIGDSPVPKAGKDQVVIKVAFSGSNPKDWKLPAWMGKSFNEGDDIAGTIHQVGENVTEFHTGDRVGAFHEMRTPGGSYAEYALAWAHTTFHIAESTSFEQASAIPLAAMTAAIGISLRLGLPAPWVPISKKQAAAKPTPLVIYGASSAVGIYALQLAKRANIHPLITIAGRAKDRVEKYLEPEKGDVVLDYREGDEKLVANIKAALKDQTLYKAFDCVSEKGSYNNLAAVLDSNGQMTNVLPLGEDAKIPESIEQTFTNVGCVHQDQQEFGHVFFKWVGKALKEGWFDAQRQEVVPGGLGGIEGALAKLKSGEASAVKYVFRIADTEGVQA